MPKKPKPKLDRKEKSMSKIFITIDQCPHGTWCVTLNDTRIVPARHCGRWVEVKRWEIDIESVKEVIREREFENA